jgi:membrane fusion protein (multidrug efflux system)
VTPPDDSNTPVPTHSAHSAHPAAHDLEFDLPGPTTLSRGRLITVGLVGAGVLALAFLFGYLPKRHAQAELVADAHAEAAVAPFVVVVTPKVMSSDHAITLSGSVRPLEETVIYPRADGYISNWLVDIGAKVKEGQTLAEIETPELDQELDQARAQLAQTAAGVTQAAANMEFSKANLERFKQLVPAGVATQQDLDKAQAQSVVDSASVSVAKAAVAVQEANIRRLMQLKSFAHVVAPFAGTITSRTVDRGTLVTAGNATPLFKVAAVDPIRVFIQVPQDVATGVKIDLDAKVTTREYPGRVFAGKVAHTAGALDQNTRTMLTEVRVPNPDNALLSGMYAEVALTLPSAHKVYELPATALLNDAHGLRVAVVDADNKLRLVPIVLERDAGATVQVSSGLTDTDRVVKLASADMLDGKLVQIKK